MKNQATAATDFVVVGSGFGGSVAALRLAEKGYGVLVLERGRRFEDADFARTNWNVRRYLWAPLLRCFGILEISAFRDVVVLHGSGVGGGSLGYAGVLAEPDDAALSAPSWSRLGDWVGRLRPHFRTAERMLGVAVNPRLWPADEVLQRIAGEIGRPGDFAPTPVGVHFGAAGREGETIPDPYFGGSGPERQTCRHCGACMVGCRYNAKNTLPKNYLFLAERLGVRIQPDSTVADIRELPEGQPDGARYLLKVRRSSGIFRRRRHAVRARNVVVAAGALGTMRLLLRCRDETRSLPALSHTLGTSVRTNSEAILGATAVDGKVDYSQGVAITSMMRADEVTTIEPVRYPAGSSLLKFLAAPLSDPADSRLRRMLRLPWQLLHLHVMPGWASRTTVLLVMQTVDTRLRMRLGRSGFTLFRRDLVSEPDGSSPVNSHLDTGHRITREFARRTGTIAGTAINERVLGSPMTAHILGGCPMGESVSEGVVDVQGRVHGYEGMYVVDGSVMPGNPGVNPSLTITAMAEYFMSAVEKKQDAVIRNERQETLSS